MRKSIYLFFLLIFTTVTTNAIGQQASPTKVFDPELNLLVARQEKLTNERTLRYRPDGEDFVIVNGKKKFNRALYGTHTGFRVETGDVPEFALYLPRMGGNLNFSLTANNRTIHLNDAAHIESRYRPGSRIYKIKDPILGNGELTITALAMSDAEGIILRFETININNNIELSWIFGGAADKRFSREGDLGVDPADSFELKAEYCVGNDYTINNNIFKVIFGAKKDKNLIGIFPLKAKLSVNKMPALTGKMKLKKNEIFHISIQIPDEKSNFEKAGRNRNQEGLLAKTFNQSEKDRAKIASTLKITTPDPFFNTLGGTIAIAADGIWDGKVWLHGAIGWRMPLSGWRAAYTGDVLGWHDRARTHFDAYAASQVVDMKPIFPHPTQDTALNFARAAKIWGTQMYSNGYISRNPNNNTIMHHYDMNLCYIDELLWHLNWTGDMDYAKKMWPVLARHLAWEKRNFDPDGDGLYNAYCCIWASDALYYNSGGVTHATAYNYRANKMAAEIAAKIGIDPQPYQQEAESILSAINQKLWLPLKGHWAEFIDFMGNKLVHESAAIWSIYHAIDSDIHDAFQAYQATRYVDTEIPHIPVTATGLPDNGYATISTTNWLPYSWSINNVAFAEVMHMSLAYWQSGRNDRAFKLLKSSVLDGMYLGSSPGNIGQISYYDAARGECYRDFGDPVGVISRAIVQGLYGILPDAMNNRLVIRPGFPSEWDHASIETSYIHFDFKRAGSKDTYNIRQQFGKKLSTEIQLHAKTDQIISLTINGKAAEWKTVMAANGYPVIAIEYPYTENAEIAIHWGGKKLDNQPAEFILEKGSRWELNTIATIVNVFDPQEILSEKFQTSNKVSGKLVGTKGHRTLFVELAQGQMKWWQPVKIEITQDEIIHQAFSAINAQQCEMVNIDQLFNDEVSNVFNNKYMSPRSPFTTLQIPTQGIGEWCHPTMTAEIDDSGLRKVAKNNVLETHFGINFRTPEVGKNIAFVSLWDNFPNSMEVPVSGKASNAYLMMAGTTNHMQCNFTNGLIIAEYTDGSSDTLKLVNPDNWCPIEQDFYIDNLAFRLKTPRHWRVHLKSGLISNNLERDLKIDGVYGRRIDGGAGVLIDMPLNKNKNLRNIRFETIANEVIIGLMSLTLQR